MKCFELFCAWGRLNGSVAEERDTRRDEFRRRIEAARAYAGISSQAKLAQAIGMNPGTFQRRLSGEYPWRRADVLAMAEVCEVPVEFFERGFVLKVQGENLEKFQVQDSAYLLSVGGLAVSTSPDRDAGPSDTDLVDAELRSRDAGEDERELG